MTVASVLERVLPTNRPEPPATSLSQDVIHDLLGNQRRRMVLDLLDDCEVWDLGRLAEYVAARENDTLPDRVDSQQRKRAYVGLYQCHLDRLDDRDVVDYNKARGIVERGSEFDGVRAVQTAGIEAVQDGEA